jgi:3-hydroxyacyl-CoA dehydrogenase
VARAWPALTALGAAQPLDAAQARLSFHARAGDAVAGADFVQENAPEKIALKRVLLAEIEEAGGEAMIIASSSSGLMPSLMQEEMTHPQRFVVGHPFNPPHLLPLVEVVGGQRTSAETIAAAMAFYARLGKQPIHIRKEVNGHVANRLQAALWREAVHLVAEGVASVADIDAAVTGGPGARWALMGPHMTLNMAGGPGGMAHFLDHLGPAFEAWWDELGTPRLDADTRQILLAGIAEAIGTHSYSELAGQRDRELVKLLSSVQPLP